MLLSLSGSPENTHDRDTIHILPEELMRRILIASHGGLATGAKSTLAFFTDKTAQIDYMSFFTDDDEEAIDVRVTKYFETIAQSDEVIVIADLHGGSVHTAFYPYLSRQGVHLVAGFNLGLLLEILSIGDDQPLVLGITEAIENAKSGMIYTNHYKIGINPDDEI